MYMFASEGRFIYKSLYSTNLHYQPFNKIPEPPSLRSVGEEYNFIFKVIPRKLGKNTNTMDY
ncbi:hypothetical protein BB561_000006 [Smittium simulii]|uniref:Uncharacterized protein n=1 Tax=Smittium simulii TaxID=133385 RepID=A0A2T9Z0Z5_9FUNG|nr:hypothetical protein BB561_000006 [Smittium simulii]